MNVNPITMVITPPTRWSRSSLMRRVPITPNTDAVARTNTTVNPATNIVAAPVTRHLPAGSEVSSPRVTAGESAPEMPARYDRYPGTSGTTHGDANDTRPARMHAATASSNGPLAAAVWKLEPTPWASSFTARPPRAR